MPRVIAPPRTVALCYVRRSWVRDEKDLVSPKMQREHIERVCAANGWTPEWYEDVDGHQSGMTEKNRPGWLALKARLEAPDIAALVAYDLSRLHRKGWRISQLLDFVDQYGIRLVIADPARQIDFSSTYGRFFAQMSAIFDEYYALDISNRRKAQAAYKRKQNISSGIPPFGTLRSAEGRLYPSPLGCWYLPDGSWRAGSEGEPAPEPNAIWRGYYACAKRILDLYVQHLGAARICVVMREEGWAFRGRTNEPAPLSKDAVRRVTKNWVEYGGIVIGTRAKDRNGSDLDPAQIPLDAERAVFDVAFLKQVGEVSRSRSFKRTDRGTKAEGPRLPPFESGLLRSLRRVGAAAGQPASPNPSAGPLEDGPSSRLVSAPERRPVRMCGPPEVGSARRRGVRATVSPPDPQREGPCGA